MKKYLALGDSYTIGESVPMNENFPHQLVSRLNENGNVVSPPEIIATTGWTTDELIKAIEEKNPSHDFDLVTLLIGVNNQYRGYDIGIYKKEFEQLLHIAIKCANGNKHHVIVVSIPDYGVTAFAAAMDKEKIHSELDQYNLISKQICEKEGVDYVDITAGSRKASDDTSLIAGDGLHPSGKMYEQWVEAMLPKVVEIIKN
ncbi:MAG: SGNH/GDSL hydrolase family protein [Bacteroidia bacterium]